MTLPDAYRLVLENDWVKVTRVTYAPHARLPAHAHTAWASAYVYLNDSGPVVFKHIGAEYGAATRPPTIAKSVRLYRGIAEVHEVENLSPLPSDFLRVEFKTDPGDPRTLRGKFFAEPPTGRVEAREQFANHPRLAGRGCRRAPRRTGPSRRGGAPTPGGRRGRVPRPHLAVAPGRPA